MIKCTCAKRETTERKNFMKKRALALALAMCLFLATQAAAAQPGEKQVYQAMIAMKDQYPEGTPWGDDNSYKWQGGVYSAGIGCAGFAFLLSDVAFGSLPARKITDFSYSDVRIGDILRINDDTHSVIVLEVRSDHVVVAEGNYNGSIHWGRILSKSEVEQGDYLMTRYAEAEEAPVPDAEDIPASGIAKASAQIVAVDGRAVEFQMYALVDENGNITNYIRLRDIAYVLNGSKAQFSVGYDNVGKSISVVSGEPYQAMGGETTAPYSGDRAYTGGIQSIQVNGEAVDMTAITLLDDAGGGYNYFKLRDLGKALGFNVGWSKDAGVFIESDKPYTEQ